MSFRLTALGDICQVTTGQSAPQETDAFGDRGTPFVRAGSLEKLCSGGSEGGLELVSAENAKKFKLKIYPENTVIFAKSGMSAAVGRVYRLRRSCHLVSHLAAVIPSERIDASYLHRWLEFSPPSRLIENEAYPSIKTSVLQQLKVPLPSVPEQRRIANILDKADVLRARRRAAITKLDRLLQSVFIEMFGDPVMNSKGWAIGSLSAHGSFKNGLNFGKDEGGVTVRYVGVGDFKSKAALKDFGSLAFVELNEIPADDYFLRDGDLLFVRSNGNRELVGRCMAVYPEMEKVTYSGFCIRYRIADASLQATYVAHLFRSVAFRRVIFQGGQGANIQNINQQTLSKLPIPIPDEGLQSQFADIVEKIEAQKQIMRRAAEKSDAFFASLQQLAFSGKL